MEVNYGAIDADDSSCHGYYIIKNKSYLYNLQSELSIDDQDIYSGEMVCEGNYFPNQYQFSLLCFTKKINNTILYIMITTNGNVNIICYGSNDVVPTCLRSISQNDYSTLSPQMSQWKSMKI